MEGGKAGGGGREEATARRREGGREGGIDVATSATITSPFWPQRRERGREGGVSRGCDFVNRKAHGFLPTS